jgi:RimJ/RimL family protein N-acetyltransferase
MSEMEQPIVNIEGALVALGPLQREHLPRYVRWMNDFGMTRMLGVPVRPMTIEAETAWYEGAAKAEARYSFTIYERSSWTAIGNCSLFDVSLQHRRAEVGVMIGEPAMRGHGYGAEALRLLLYYAFTILGLHSVMLHVFAYNAPAIRCYEKVGFREIGRRRESHWLNGRYWDDISMDMLASEFDSLVQTSALDHDMTAN